MSFSLDHTPGPAIYRTAARLKQVLGARLKPFDITPEQFSLLARLWEEDGLTQSRIAELLHKDKANVTRILDRLVAKGLVERRTDPQDRRAFHVYLTGEGRAAEARLAPPVEALRARIYAGISGEEQRRLVTMLDRILANLEADAGDEGHG